MNSYILPIKSLINTCICRKKAVPLGVERWGYSPAYWSKLQVMKKETKDLLITMVESWNKFNPRRSVDVDLDDSEFSPKHWSLDMSFGGVVSSDFIAFLLPALIAQDCIWFVSGLGNRVILHIQ